MKREGGEKIKRDLCVIYLELRHSDVRVTGMSARCRKIGGLKDSCAIPRGKLSVPFLYVHS